MTSAVPVNDLLPGTPRPRPAPAIDVPGSLQAMRRAALKARQLAQSTGTALIVVRSGQLVRVLEDIAPLSGIDR